MMLRGFAGLGFLSSSRVLRAQDKSRLRPAQSGRLSEQVDFLITGVARAQSGPLGAVAIEGQITLALVCGFPGFGGA